MAALLIVGHGSTLNPDSSAPTHRHADEIRRRGIFDEVACAFWKEEPSMREVYYMLRSREIFIVPNFISEGYFCQQVIPRELELTGPVTRREDGTTLYYCDPVGIHQSMTRLLLKRADEVAPCVPRDQICLIIVGHGTTLNDNSTKAIEEQVRLIKEGGHGFAEVLDAYMEQPPLVAKWAEMSSAAHVVVVPFFIADGLHSYQDIPVLLGIEAEPTAAMSQHDVFRHNPHMLQGRQLYYSSAIGTDELLAEVILDQVTDFQRKHSLPPLVRESGAASGALPNGDFTIGQVRAHRLEDGWSLTHVSDAGGGSGLHSLPDISSLRELSLYDDQGVFRPIKGSPDLQRGWLLNVQDDTELRLALDFLYPAALGMYEHWKAGTLKPVPIRETLGRQTGMYRFANTIRDEQALSLAAAEAAKSLRRLLYTLDGKIPLTDIPADKLPDGPVAQDEIPLLAVEADTHFVGAARELARENFQAAQKAATES